MSARLRVGIVGCGSIAGNHAAAYRALNEVELLACCDADPARAARFSADHGIEHAVSDPEELFHAGVDVVSVCTPHPTHEEIVTAAAPRGVHVLCEKPIATNLESASRMVTACEEAGVWLGVLFQRRFWSAAARIRAAIDAGALGTPILGQTSVLLHRDADYYTADAWRGTWATDGGGVLMTQAIHNIDLLQWFMGEAVEASASYGAFKHQQAIEVEDTLVATLRFATGAFATVSASTALTPGLGTRVLISGSSGATVGLAEYPEGHEAINDVWAVPGDETVRPPYEQGLTGDIPLARINAALAPLHARQVGEFVGAVHNGTEPAVTGREALKSLGIVSAIYASAASGKPEPVPARICREDDCR